MFSTRAHSFRKRAKLAMSLSWIGGYTNIIALLTCGSVASHLTGTSTLLGRALAEGDHSHAAFYVFCIGAFFCGAVSSAIMTETAKALGRRSIYVLPISVEIALLTVFAIVVAFELHVAANDVIGLYSTTGLATFAMGLQNATITRISGSVIRTTHLTGIVTDLGIESVQAGFAAWQRVAHRRRGPGSLPAFKLIQSHPTLERLFLLAMIFSMFLLGTLLGTLAYEHWLRWCMAPPVLFLAAIVVFDWKQPIAGVRRFAVGEDSELRGLGIVETMLPAGLAVYELFGEDDGKHQHKAPNFQLWGEQIAADVRCIVLRLAPFVEIDGNAALDLRSAIDQLHARGKRIVLASVTAKQSQELHDRGVADTLGFANLFADVELAVARGIDLAQIEHRHTAAFPTLNRALD
jgi:uncharacterized membrane protein YoaK (UPF0700 family)